jgi:Arsenical resistance operon protein ArsD
MSVVSVYEPATGCLTGACGPDAAAEIAAFEEALNVLLARGVTVHRFNLGYDPEEFASNPVVKDTIRQKGMDGLPVVFVDGSMIIQGRYPTPEQLGV